MLIISHRGNLEGENESTENSPSQIETAINFGYDVEIDLWLIDNDFMLGHDKPEHPISLDWLVSNEKFLWVHCKNFEAIDYLSKNKINLNYFFHDSDDLTLTSRNFMWIYPKKIYSNNSIIVCKDDDEFKNYLKKPPLGVCTDNPHLLKKLISE